MGNGAGEGQRNRQQNQALGLLRGGIVGALMALGMAGPVGAAGETPMPGALVWICAHADSGTRCFDTYFESPVIVDCGNPRPLTAYEGGGGVMIVWDAEGQPHRYAYGSRSYNVRGGPGNLDVIRLFPDDGLEFGSKGDFEHCETYVRP